MRRDVFQAIADPTRRTIIHVLREQPLTINKLAQNFTISRPAISKQVKILSQCGLINIKQEGRERYCHLNLTSFNTLNDWMRQYHELWEDKSKVVEKVDQVEVDKITLEEEAEKERIKNEEKQNGKKAPKQENPFQYSLF